MIRAVIGVKTILHIQINTSIKLKIKMNTGVKMQVSICRTLSSCIWRFFSFKQWEHCVRFVSRARGYKYPRADTTFWEHYQAWAKNSVDLSRQDTEIKTKVLFKLKCFVMDAVAKTSNWQADAHLEAAMTCLKFFVPLLHPVGMNKVRPTGLPHVKETTAKMEENIKIAFPNGGGRGG